MWNTIVCCEPRFSMWARINGIGDIDVFCAVILLLLTDHELINKDNISWHNGTVMCKALCEENMARPMLFHK